jgi:hypothetical protein
LFANTVLGGVAAVAGGGKFENGAITGAFGYLFNEMGSYAQRGYEPTMYSDSVGTICNAAYGSGCFAEGVEASSFLEDTALVLTGVGSLVRGLLWGVEAIGYTFSETIAGYVADRPYMSSTLLINEIVANGSVAPDVVAGYLRYTAPGTLWNSSWGAGSAASQGTYELVIDPQTNTIVHFLFKAAK